MDDVLAPAFEIKPPLLERAAKIKLMLFDVDGVLTDGRLFLGDGGQEYKAFHSRDGHGIKMLMQSGIEVGIITGRTSKVVEHRASDLGIHYLYQGCLDKLPVYEKLRGDIGLEDTQTAFMGDDVVDLPIMLRVGLALTVQNAHPLVKQHAHWTTPSHGGAGAARDGCEMLLFAQGAYARIMRNYL